MTCQKKSLGASVLSFLLLAGCQSGTTPASAQVAPPIHSDENSPKAPSSKNSSSEALPQTNEGAIVETANGKFILDSTDQHIGTAYRDEKGLLWSKKLILVTGDQKDADDACTNIGLRGPTGSELYSLSKYLGKTESHYSPYLADGKTEFIEGLSQHNVWSAAHGIYYVFKGDTGTVQDSTDFVHGDSALCVSDAYTDKQRNIELRKLAWYTTPDVDAFPVGDDHMAKIASGWADANYIYCKSASGSAMVDLNKINHKEVERVEVSGCFIRAKNGYIEIKQAVNYSSQISILGSSEANFDIWAQADAGGGPLDSPTTAWLGRGHQGEGSEYGSCIFLKTREIGGLENLNARKFCSQKRAASTAK